MELIGLSTFTCDLIRLKILSYFIRVKENICQMIINFTLEVLIKCKKNGVPHWEVFYTKMEYMFVILTCLFKSSLL